MILFNANSAIFPAIWWQEQVNFQWDDDEIRFVLNQHAELDFYSAKSLKQQSTGRHVAPSRHIILKFVCFQCNIYKRYILYSCLYPFIKLWFIRERERAMVFNTIFNNISAISWWSVLLVEETWVLGKNHRPAASYNFISKYYMFCVEILPYFIFHQDCQVCCFPT